MELCRDYLPTRSYKIAEMRMGSLLGSEIDRLDKVAAKFGRTYAIGPDNLKDELPNIISFAGEYQRAYDSRNRKSLSSAGPRAATAAIITPCR